MAAANWYDTGKIILTKVIYITGHTYQGFARELKQLRMLLDQETTTLAEKLPYVIDSQSAVNRIMKYAGC